MSSPLPSHHIYLSVARHANNLRALLPDDLLAQLKNLKIENQMLEGVDGTPATVAERTPDNKLVVIPTVVTAGGNGSAGTAAHCITSLLTVIAILLW
ncbi:hypothetical protein EVAR_94599_1 [Eumeta japonica]|uniref:Uncharacterized protein n=1 Tax=Eumeta variegata TaxID=151549 RepID=A0A4C1UTY7_EUMVA|nr:hypothetical protein EVAR_94599_1 [Eumeta japonica]